MVSKIAHGGALAAAIKKYGGTREDWIDLSTGLNPVSAPLPRLEPHVWQALPDADLKENCLKAAREFYGIPMGASMAAASGVQALIQLLPHLRPGQRAAILGPTYGEYAHVFQTLGGGCRIIGSIREFQDESVVIIVNPNNPDGKTHKPEMLLGLADTLSKRKGLLIVDEAFCDLTPDLSVAGHTGKNGLLVLKSFGKFFGLAGVRLGFAAGHTEDVAVIEMHLGPWAVSGPALAWGSVCYSNGELRSKITRSILRNSASQRRILANANLKVVAEAGLFHLIELPKATAVYEALAKNHILTRKFSDQPDWLRLGLCKNDVERARLTLALKSSLSAL